MCTTAAKKKNKFGSVYVLNICTTDKIALFVYLYAWMQMKSSVVSHIKLTKLYVWFQLEKCFSISFDLPKNK